MKSQIAALALVASLSACATPYGPMGLMGGVTVAPIMTDTYRITAKGNGYTSSERIQDYVLLKAAEQTRDAGSDYFVIVSSADASANSVGVTPGYASTQIVGNTAFTTVSPGYAYNIYKPGQDIYIRVIRGAAPAGAFRASEIITNIGGRIYPKKAAG